VIVIGGLLVCLVALAPLANAQFGAPDLDVAKHADGPWRNHSVNVHMAQGETKTLYLRVKNTTDPPQGQDATLRDATPHPPGETPPYQVSWYRRDKDISDDVQTGGYDFSLRPHDPKRFRLKVTAIDASRGECVAADVHASPGGGGADLGVFHINLPPAGGPGGATTCGG
jgi:hypothetical protein